MKRFRYRYKVFMLDTLQGLNKTRRGHIFIKKHEKIYSFDKA